MDVTRAWQANHRADYGVVASTGVSLLRPFDRKFCLQARFPRPADSAVRLPSDAYLASHTCRVSRTHMGPSTKVPTHREFHSLGKTIYFFGMRGEPFRRLAKRSGPPCGSLDYTCLPSTGGSRRSPRTFFVTD